MHVNAAPEAAGYIESMPVTCANEATNKERSGICRRRLVGAAFVAASLWLPAGACLAADARQLLHDYKCYICHADDAWKAGPAFRDIAASYRASRRPASAMARVIRRGQHGSGPWHMPPHPEVSRVDAKAMADYILALR